MELETRNPLRGIFIVLMAVLVCTTLAALLTTCSSPSFGEERPLHRNDPDRNICLEIAHHVKEHLADEKHVQELAAEEESRAAEAEAEQLVAEQLAAEEARYLEKERLAAEQEERDAAEQFAANQAAQQAVQQAAETVPASEPKPAIEPGFIEVDPVETEPIEPTQPRYEWTVPIADSVPSDGIVNIYGYNWFQAHSNTYWGKCIASFRPGDVVVVNGISYTIEGCDYCMAGDSVEGTMANYPGRALFSTCTERIVGEAYLFYSTVN